MTDQDTATILTDARWLPLRYDMYRDEIHFVWLPREAHRAAAFLTSAVVAETTPKQIVPRAAITEASFEQAPLHIILHSGLTGSTLLTHALDRQGTAMTLSEPPILTNVVSYALSGAPVARVAQVFGDVVRLLARPFSPGEAVIIKMGSVANRLGGDILAHFPDSKALSLHAPLPVYLASIARKGLWGRIWGRKLFETLRSAKMTDLGFSDAEFFEHTDLQIGADAWLILHRVMANVASAYGPRVRSLDSERLMAQPEQAIGAVAAHFGLLVDAGEIVADPLFQRHAKTGESFNAGQRAGELRDAAVLHREEIGVVMDWARSVATTQGIGWDLPRPLIA